MMREHKFLGGNRENLCVKEFRGDNTPPVREKKRMDLRDKRKETTRDCGGRNESQIIGEKKRNGRLVGVAETSKEHSE